MSALHYMPCIDVLPPLVLFDTATADAAPLS